MSDYQLVTGDCREALAAMQPESIDACITDPPYELGFMGKAWDRAGVAFDADTWRAVHRVLKPGARLLAFGGSRTHHRIWCAIEDAGFVLEDTMMWLYGSGFPKHKSKLKPAFEPVCVARKGSVSELNIDAARIECLPGSIGNRIDPVDRPARRPVNHMNDDGSFAKPRAYVEASGRWPANVALDEEAARLLDAQSGELLSGANPTRRNSDKFRGTYAPFAGQRECTPARGADMGGASRFFYVAKADRAERDAGLESAPLQPGGSNAKGFTADVAAGNNRNRAVANHHPTVKPIALMRWLVRLVTEPGAQVLDPFCGSGSTGVACMQEGRNFVGVELNPEYVQMARRRIAAAPLSLFGGVA